MAPNEVPNDIAPIASPDSAIRRGERVPFQTREGTRATIIDRMSMRHRSRFLCRAAAFGAAWLAFGCAGFKPQPIEDIAFRERSQTGNVIESAFATVRLRQRVTKGAGSRRKGLLMAFKLLVMAELRWRRINGLKLIPLVRAGASFHDGLAVELGVRTGRAA